MIDIFSHLMAGFQAALTVTNLAFMAAGPLPPNAADLLASARMVSLLSSLPRADLNAVLPNV